MNIKAILKLPGKIPHAARIELLALRDVIRFGLPDVMLQFGGGIGDELLLTAVAHELKQRKGDLNIWQVSHSAPLLENNPDYDKVFTQRHWALRYAQFLKPWRLKLAYAQEIIPCVSEVPPSEHVISILCRNAGITGEIALRPYLFLTDKERLQGKIAPLQIAVQCVGPDSYATVRKNMLWASNSFQIVVDVLRRIMPDTELVQLGSDKDPLLSGTIDMRGVTSLRESAAILSNSLFFLGIPGLLMHLARSIECRSVMVYGGREHSFQTGYICNENLGSNVECSPCWLWNDCDYD